MKVQKPEKAQLGTLENMYVQYDCNRPIDCTFRDLLRKRSVLQNVLIGHSCEPKVAQSKYTPKGTTRPFHDILQNI